MRKNMFLFVSWEIPSCTVSLSDARLLKPHILLHNPVPQKASPSSHFTFFSSKIFPVFDDHGTTQDTFVVIAFFLCVELYMWVCLGERSVLFSCNRLVHISQHSGLKFLAACILEKRKTEEKRKGEHTKEKSGILVYAAYFKFLENERASGVCVCVSSSWLKPSR